MGSTAEVLAWCADPGVDADGLLDWAVAETERLEQCWSRFRAGSELRRAIAAATSGDAVPVSATLWLALERAAQGWRETGGLFDPTVGTALDALGYDRDFRELDPDRGGGAGHGSGGGHGSAAGAPVAGFAAVRLDPAARTLALAAGVAVDLGGIGKGLAADLVSAGLVERGATSVLVSFGGDLRVRGPGPHDGAWEVPVESPLDGAPLGTFPLVDEAIVQSTDRFRRWRAADGTPVHHLVDPRTGRPAATGTAAVIVTGPEAWRCEVFAKAAFVTGPDAAVALLEAAGLDGWVLGADGRVAATGHVRDDLR